MTSYLLKQRLQLDFVNLLIFAFIAAKFKYQLLCEKFNIIFEKSKKSEKFNGSRIKNVRGSDDKIGVNYKLNAKVLRLFLVPWRKLRASKFVI